MESLCHPEEGVAHCLSLMARPWSCLQLPCRTDQGNCRVQRPLQTGSHWERMHGLRWACKVTFLAALDVCGPGFPLVFLLPACPFFLPPSLSSHLTLGFALWPLISSHGRPPACSRLTGKWQLFGWNTGSVSVLPGLGRKNHHPIMIIDVNWTRWVREWEKGWYYGHQTWSGQ